MRKWLKLFKNWSWLVTLPISVIFIYWGWVTVDRYITFGVRYNPAPAQMSLLHSGTMEASHLYRNASLSLSERKIHNDSNNILRTINLFVPESNLAKLNSNLPHSGFEYVKGGIVIGKKLQKVKVKYRGDFIHHWGIFKKSFRIKTKKKSLFEGMRAFNIVAPKGVFHLHNYLGYRLADYLELMTPRAKMVQLNLNGKRQGLHLMVEQLEELTLRRHSRMPGDLYVGELISKDAYHGVDHAVFSHPGLWKKISFNNHYPLESRKPIERLLQLINAPVSEQVQEQFREIMDLEAWAKFSVFETLTQTFHFDKEHNWRLYYDPMRSKFEPIIWDPLAWTSGFGKKPHLEAIRTRLHKALFRDAEFMRMRQKILENFYINGLDEKYLKETDEVINNVMRVIEKDPNLSHPPKKIKSMMKKVSLRIEEVFDFVKTNTLSNNGKILYSVEPEGINLSIGGRRPVQKLTLNYEKPIKGNISATLSYLRNDQKIVKNIIGRVSILGGRLEINIPLMCGMKVLYGKRDIENYIEVSPGYFTLKVSGISEDNKLHEVFVERGIAERVYAKHEKNIKKSSFYDLFNIVQAHPFNVPKRWSGTVEINGVETIDSELIVEAGTIIRMNPGAGVILKNRLIAEGTADNPIQIIPNNEGQDPWGAIVIRGEKANSSRLSHCEIAGGSGLKGDLFEYTAMFSVHDVEDIKVNNCVFRDSQKTDDMVHTVYAEIEFYDTRFERSLMDALDIDISDAFLENCYFVGSGNDSIDLMTSNAVIYDTLIEKSGDKAASVGEGSFLLAINNVFRANAIGVQVKDGSVASLYNLDLIENAHAIDAYKKNWRYNDGGNIYLYKSRVKNNEKMITADKHSTIKVYDSYIDTNIGEKRKRIKLSKTVDRVNEWTAETENLKRNKNEIQYMKRFDAMYWDRITTTKRGSSKVAHH